LANRRSFFIFPLRFRVGSGDEGSWFALAKSQPVEQSLTLTHANSYPVGIGQMVAEELSVPQVLRVFELSRRPTKIFAHRFSQGFIHGRGTARTRLLLQTSKTALFKTAYPGLNSTGAVTKQLGHLVATESSADHENPMEPMVISRFIGPKNFILNRNPHNFCISDFQFAHRYLLSAHSIAERHQMRNYLCRYV
jgi:hypothetical protein